MTQVRFTGITVWKAIFPLRLTFSHNLSSRNRAETLLLRLETANGRAGYGQALPRAYLTGESLDSALQDITQRWWPWFRDREFTTKDGFDGILEQVAPAFREADARRLNASYAAMDMAVMDALCAEAGVPAARAGTWKAAPLPLVAAIPASSPGKAGWLARILFWLGYRRFKIKVGRDAVRDGMRIRAVAGAVGARSRLDADANGAWDADEAVHRMRALREHGIGMIEEPLNRECAAAADFSRLERETGLAVMADESLCTLADADALVRRGSPSHWNMRVAKNGGFAGMAALAKRAAEAGISRYGGVLVGETGVLAAAGRAAMFGVGVACGEYGFSRVFLQGDPFRGSPNGYRGTLGPPRSDRPGLGVTPASPSMGPYAEAVWAERV